MLSKEKKRKTKAIFIKVILLTTLLTLPVRAEELKVLTLEKVFESVESAYPSVLLARKDTTIANNKLLSLQGSFDTMVNLKGEARPLGYYQNGAYDVFVEQPTTLWGSSFFGGFKIGGGKYASYEGKNETNELGEFRTGLEIPLLKDGLTDRRRTNIAQAEIKQYEAEMKVFKKLIESKQIASQKYWKWVSTGKVYKIQKDILTIALERDKSLLDSANLGQIPPIESTENKRVIFQREGSLLSAERSLQQASSELSIYYRNDKGLPFIPSLENMPDKLLDQDLVSTIKLEEDIKKAFQKHPELKIITLNLQQAELELKYLDNQNLPEIDFSLAISQDLGKGSKTRDPFVMDTGIILKAPLQMRNARGKYYEQETIIEQLKLQESFLKEQIRVEVMNDYYALKASYQQLLLARKELKLALQLEKAEKDKFKFGDSNLLFINLREQTTADTMIREINALVSYNIALNDYKAALSII